MTLLTINVNIHGATSDQLGAINHRLDTIMSVLSDLQAAVAAEDTVIESAVTLLQGLGAALAAAGTDPVALKALSDDIAAKTKSLADAVAANPVPPPAP